MKGRGAAMTDDDTENVRYRTAYGLAAELLEVHFFDMGSGRHRNNPAAGDTVRIRAEVIRQLGDSKAVRDGIDDALAGRIGPTGRAREESTNSKPR
jgi:hypothetical protein